MLYCCYLALPLKSLRPRSIWIPCQLLLLSLRSRESELDPDLYDPEGDAVLLLISWQEFSQVNIFLNLNWNSTRVKFLVKLVLENKQQLGVCIQAINSQQCNSQAYMLQSRSTRKCKIYRFAQLLFTVSVSGHK
jgi:hypothetical protein